ncbi:MAG: benzoyl-CoA reductase subunit A [Deltaproteobacteria bacterium]|nr:benzoyl-CoA reductase subunit A [Deltaproteobacteria bacterium]
MKTFLGTDLGSTTTKSILLDEAEQVLGRGITNSRSNYELAAEIARDEAYIGAKFELLGRRLGAALGEETRERLSKTLLHQFRRAQHLTQLEALKEKLLAIAEGRESLRSALAKVLDEMEREAKRPKLEKDKSEFFHDRAASAFSRAAEHAEGQGASFDDLMGCFDKAILVVENSKMDLTFESNIDPAAAVARRGESDHIKAVLDESVRAVKADPLEVTRSIGTGYGRRRLPFPKEDIRSEILCHGLGAHVQFPKTATVLDIGGQDTKAIQVDDRGIVTSFQMNDRCAAGCGRYLGYIADEMNLGVHELGPLAMESTRFVKINSTCTVFAGAELRDRLSMGQRREDILAGLHRAIILRAMALLARSGGIYDEFTFTGGVANNVAAVKALRQLIEENYGSRTLNISASSIYTGAHGAALFAKRAWEAAA